ncbi:MAG: hypothetical protein Kow0031_02570 [Anaerolineae bacterium]
MTQLLRMFAPLLLLAGWLWRGRKRRVEPPPELPTDDEARFFEAEWREAEQTALSALQELDQALETIADLHLQLDEQWEFTRELLLLNACGYFSNVRFDYDDEGLVQGVYLSQGDRIRFAPATHLDRRVPPAQWNRN